MRGGSCAIMVSSVSGALCHVCVVRCLRRTVPCSRNSRMPANTQVGTHSQTTTAPLPPTWPMSATRSKQTCVVPDTHRAAVTPRVSAMRFHVRMTMAARSSPPPVATVLRAGTQRHKFGVVAPVARGGSYRVEGGAGGSGAGAGSGAGSGSGSGSPRPAVASPRARAHSPRASSKTRCTA